MATGQSLTQREFYSGQSCLRNVALADVLDHRTLTGLGQQNMSLWRSRHRTAVEEAAGLGRFAGCFRAGKAATECGDQRWGWIDPLHLEALIDEGF